MAATPPVAVSDSRIVYHRAGSAYWSTAERTAEWTVTTGTHHPLPASTRFVWHASRPPDSGSTDQAGV